MYIMSLVMRILFSVANAYVVCLLVFCCPVELLDSLLAYPIALAFLYFCYTNPSDRYVCDWAWSNVVYDS